VRPFIELQKTEQDSEFFLFLANMHGFTQTHNPDELRANTMTIAKLYMACGVDLQRTLIYNPALIPAHAQLVGGLLCLRFLGTWGGRQGYKDALAKGKAGEI